MGRPKGSRNKFRRFEIEREPDELDEDYERRRANAIAARWRERNPEKAREYMREKRARERAVAGPPKIRGKDLVPRKNARPAWLREECDRREGESEEDHKRRASRAVMAWWRSNNQEHDAENRRRDQRGARYRKKRQQWAEANPEKVKQYQKVYFDKNREQRLAILRAWGQENPDRLRDARRKWAQEHPEKFLASAAHARARIVQATPSWVRRLFWKEIEAVYRKSKRLTKLTGIPHHVDHVYPLAGKTSCGLHVTWNLQVVPATVNMKKHNRAPTDDELIALAEELDEITSEEKDPPP